MSESFELLDTAGEISGKLRLIYDSGMLITANQPFGEWGKIFLIKL